MAPYRTEIPPRGAIAMAANGVPAFGAMESDSANAVETAAGTVGNAGYWYGHASPFSAWHFHVSSFGPFVPVPTSWYTNTLVFSDIILSLAHQRDPTWAKMK